MGLHTFISHVKIIESQIRFNICSFKQSVSVCAVRFMMFIQINANCYNLHWSWKTKDFMVSSKPMHGHTVVVCMTIKTLSILSKYQVSKQQLLLWTQALIKVIYMACPLCVSFGCVYPHTKNTNVWSF